MMQVYPAMRNLGVGLKYNEFLSSNEGDFSEKKLIGVNSYETKIWSASNNIRTKFIGPIFSVRGLNSKNTNCFMIDIGVGYVDYRSKGVMGYQGKEREIKENI